MRTLPVVVLAIGLLAACSGRRDDAERKARTAAEAAEAAADRARARGADLADRARTHGADLADRAAEAKHAAVAFGERALDRVDLGRARSLASQAKAELDKVYRSNTDYDLDITTRAATTAHAEQLAAMPHVTVGGVTVGYEQVAGLSTTGTSSKRHFRATWRRGDRDVIVGYQTESRLDLAAFAALLPKLVPIVDRLL